MFMKRKGEKTVHNPTGTDVWVWQDGKTTCIPAATTVNL